MAENGRTTDGKVVEVIDAGLYNRQGRDPDFFNAKLKLNGVLWVGNVVVAENASDWYLHGMDKDNAYDNVILVVVGTADTDIFNSKEQPVNVMPMEVPQNVAKRHQVPRVRACRGVVAVPEIGPEQHRRQVQEFREAELRDRPGIQIRPVEARDERVRGEQHLQVVVADGIRPRGICAAFLRQDSLPVPGRLPVEGVRQHPVPDQILEVEEPSGPVNLLRS